MKLRIGDKVRFLNEVGEGTVSRIKDKTTVFVEMEDGFEIPFQETQLVPIHTELIVDKDTENMEMDPEAQIDEALYLILEPDHELPQLMSDYRIYLFNASAYHVLYTYSVMDETHYQTVKHGEAGPFQKIALKTIKPDFLKNYQYHCIQTLFFKNTFYKSQQPVSQKIQITKAILQQSYKIDHPEFDRQVYAFLLKEDFLSTEQVHHDITFEDLERLRTVKEFGTRQKASKSSKAYLKSLEKEVDLHIEELVDSVKGLTNHDMLSIQLERFEKELDAAIESHLKKITFIHGVGNGRLKYEIQRILKSTKGITYQDASFKEYGFGATQVNIS